MASYDILLHDFDFFYSFQGEYDLRRETYKYF